VSYEEWKATFGQSMERNVEMWMAGLDQRKFNEYCDDHYADHLDHLHILDGSIDLLQLVNRKYGKEHVAIVTNWSGTATIIHCHPQQRTLHSPFVAETIRPCLLLTLLYVSFVRSVPTVLTARERSLRSY